jgi:hypothetical protein
MPVLRYLSIASSSLILAMFLPGTKTIACLQVDVFGGNDITFAVTLCFMNMSELTLLFGCLFLADVIGQIVSIEEEGQAWKWEAWRNMPFRNLYLRDLR